MAGTVWSNTVKVLDSAAWNFTKVKSPRCKTGTRGTRQEIVFKSTGAEAAGQGLWTLRGNLTMRGQTWPVTVQVKLKDGRYTGETTVKQTEFGIKPPGKAGVPSQRRS